MDFFTAQDDARRKTRLLMLLFGFAIVVLIVLTNVFLMIATGMMAMDPEQSQTSQGISGVASSMASNFSWSQFFAVGAAVLLVIFAGSAFRTFSLRGGGKTVAESLGGRLITGNTTDNLERRLINVVEEIAIASGTPVPLVYVMDNEPGINAFAAGQSTGDAVVAVTRGTLELLSRSELQGVIAHEFSHILNGDMRINMRLVGILFGILMLGIIGRFMLRSAMYSSIGRSRGKDNNGAILIGIGLGLFILGYAGTFFGNIIKAAVSRQREFLADASAVQFTRDPDGISGALMKIGGSIDGSKMLAPDAEEFSHAYFGEGLSHMFGLMATHPPLKDRIRRVQPAWDGKFVTPKPIQPESVKEDQSRRDARSRAENLVTGAVVLGGVMDAIERTGQATVATLDQAVNTLDALPRLLLDAAHEPYGARALIYALVIDLQTDLRESQLAYLQENADTGVADMTERTWPVMRDIAASQRLTIIDLALPALRQLSDSQYQLFRDNLQKLIEFDGVINIFEWSLQRIVLHYLDQDFGLAAHTRGRLKSLKSMVPETTVLISFLVKQTQTDNTVAQDVYTQALTTLGIPERELLPNISIQQLDLALGKLARLKPLDKPQLLKSCATAILADEQVTAEEAELLRAFSAILDCPMPPLLT